MKQNVGRIDKLIRFAISAALVVVGFFLLDSQAAIASALFVSAAVLAMTALLGQCGLYRLFGIDTCPVKLDGKKKE